MCSAPAAAGFDRIPVRYRLRAVHPRARDRRAGDRGGAPGADGIRPDGRSAAEVLYAGTAPGLVGVTQINVRLPEGLPAGRVSVMLTVAGAESRPGITIWIR